jgi:RHS repeat-associated protein
MMHTAAFTNNVHFSQHHFTGKERDTESGNDYFDARYYSSAMGRFLSPDWSAKEEPVPYAKLDNPQTLNLYSYVQNNPLARTDPDGHEECCDITADELRAAFATAGAIISAPEAALAGVAAGAVVAAGYSAAQGNSPYLSNGYPTSFNLNPTSSNASPSPNASSPQASGQQSTPAQPPDGGGKSSLADQSGLRNRPIVDA